MAILIYGLPMKPIYRFKKHIQIRLYQWCSLIFFALILLPSCKQKQPKQVSIIWDKSKAVALLIPAALINDADIVTAKAALRISLAKTNNGTAILGDIEAQEGDIIFRPLVPFTHGLAYDVLYNDKVVSSIQIPSVSNAAAPLIKDIYPTSDTLPENLLKLYIQFSQPMQEGISLQHIALLDEHKDTMQATFLDLQPELWNEDRTILTLWLDPGRIKRDLIPNKKMGNPLKSGSSYTLIVSNNWKSAAGLALQQTFTKQFVVTERDGTSPDINQWKILLPAAATNQPLQVFFNEPLDYFLLQETIQVMDNLNNKVAGKLVIDKEEKSIKFIPADNWHKGVYTIQVQSILEDAAGNNLNRLFDRDTWLKNAKKDQQIFIRPFKIQ